MKRILVTGGAGFIGSEFVRQIINKDFKVTVVDKLTYAGDFKRLENFKNKFKFYKTDICNIAQIESVFCKEKPDIVIHFAAESHVDRSIQNTTSFIETNVKGTQILLDESRRHSIKRFIHISTDEVYGEIRNGKFNENSPLNPSSPYSASKAAADCLVKSYIRTFNFPGIIVRPSNNYGPWQYPEKFIPVIIYNALTENKIPLYAQGLNKREWLHISDCAEAIFLVLRNGKIGEIYNVGSNLEKRNIDIVCKILRILNKSKCLIQYVKDRPGHDYRYALNFLKIQSLGWKPRFDFEKGIQETVAWYEHNFSWLKNKVDTLREYWKIVYK